MSLALLTLLLSIQTQSPQTPVTVEEYLELKDLGAVQVSPDGGSVAFTVTKADLESSEYRTELYLWRPDGGPRALTTRRADVRMPRWSADGAWLAFLSKGAAGKDGASHRQVWLLPLAQGGEAIQLTRRQGGVFDYGWAPDGSIYILTLQAEPALLEAIAEQEKKAKDDPVVVRDEAERPREFWRIATPDGEAEYVGGGERGISEFALSPDGRSIVYATNYTGAVGDFTSFDLWVLGVDSGDPRRLTDRAGSETSPVWSPDGRTIVFQAPQKSELSYSQTELFSMPAAGGTPTNLTDAFDRAVLAHRWPAGGELVLSAALGTYTHLFELSAAGALQRLTSGPLNYTAFDAAPGGGTIYAVRESATEGTELWRVAGTQAERLTTLNERIARWKLGRQEVIQWTAPDGLTIEGVLVYPADYQDDRRYPLLVNPHGGPSSRARDVLDQFHGYQLFAAQGYAVLAPNFRGSTGYGETFGTANREDLAGGDFSDLMAGVDHAIEMGIADSARLGIYGGSYGGYMTNWTISRTQRFKSAVSMYGIFSLITDYSNSNIPRWEYEYLRAHYWEDLDRYLDRSPMRYVTDIHTPVLIIHGAEDPNTFISNSNEMYRALVDLGRTVEFVKYPREGHGIREPRHRIDLFFRQLRWFDKYIRFGGAELDFYLVDDWVPGPSGWELNVVSSDVGVEYAGAGPTSGRYLEVVLALRPDSASANRSAGTPLELDLASDVALLGGDDGNDVLLPAGIVTQLFGLKMLVSGSSGRLTVPPPARGATNAVAVSLAFAIPEEPAEYLLRVRGFGPIRIWAGPQE